MSSSVQVLAVLHFKIGILVRTNEFEFEFIVPLTAIFITKTCPLQEEGLLWIRETPQVTSDLNRIKKRAKTANCVFFNKELASFCHIQNITTNMTLHSESSPPNGVRGTFPKLVG